MLLEKLPGATKVDEDSDEFRDVTEAFNRSMREYKNKIRIVQVQQKIGAVFIYFLILPCL